MYNLQDIFGKRFTSFSTDMCNGKLMCVIGDRDSTLLTNDMPGGLSWYSFTLITEGKLTLDNGNGLINFSRNEMYVFYTGSPIHIHHASDDYKSICLLIDERMTHDTHGFRNLIKASAIPITKYGNCRITLGDDDAGRLFSLMSLIRQYIQRPLSLKDDILEALCAAFINDLISIRAFDMARLSISRRYEDLFISFYSLLTHNYRDKRDITFYADRLNITTTTSTYLSRIVKRITGRTVVQCVNELIAMDAT